jgi:hypothetical protein
VPIDRRRHNDSALFEESHMTARKKLAGTQRKLKLGKQTVKDLSTSRKAGRGAKGGFVRTNDCGTVSVGQTLNCGAQTTPYKGVQSGP